MCKRMSMHAPDPLCTRDCGQLCGGSGEGVPHERTSPRFPSVAVSRAERATLGREALRVKIAVPIFGSRVSPRFDCAQAFLLVTADERTPWQRQQVAAANWAPHERVNRLMELGVHAVICGGIDCWSAESLRSGGILVCNSITGDVDEALDSLLRGGMFADRCARTCAVPDPPPLGPDSGRTASELDGARSWQCGRKTGRRQRRRGGNGGRGASG
jgi:predicted Fe-Mo cluster-binding NifX family protein